MKKIILLLTFLFATINAQNNPELELMFESFVDTEWDYRHAAILDLHFFNDSIMIEIVAKEQNDDFTYTFVMGTNNYTKWDDLGPKLLKNFDFSGITKTTLKREFATFNPKTTEFIRYNIALQDSHVYWMNLNGDITKKVKLIANHHYAGETKIILNPYDENFVGYYFKYQRPVSDEFFDQLYYTTDRGDNWTSLYPETYYYEIRGGFLYPGRSIDYVFSSTNKGKMFFRFIWERFMYFTGMYAIYDYYNNEFLESPSIKVSVQNMVCYECPEEKTILTLDGRNLFKRTDGHNELILETSEILRDNIDTLDFEDEQYDQANWASSNKDYKVNFFNPKHHVIKIGLNIWDENDIPLGRDHYFFQSFDAGETWEFVLHDNDYEYRVPGFWINPYDNTFWILKFNKSNSFIKRLYRLKNPLTRVKTEKDEKKAKVILSNNKLIIESEKVLQNVNINIYDINGREIFTQFIDIVQGEKEIPIHTIPSQLLLIKLQSSNKQYIYKLIRSDSI